MNVDAFNVVDSKASSSKAGAIRDFDRSDILNEPLAVFLAILDGKVPRNNIEEMIEIICDLDFDVKLFSSQVGSYNTCRIITEEIIDTCRDK